jgi:hypothetical protein
MVKTGLTREDSPGLRERDCAMRLRRLLRITVAGSALGLTVMAAPVMAQGYDEPQPPLERGQGMPHHRASMPQGEPYSPSPEARSRWLAECTERFANSRRSDGRDYRYSYESRKVRAARAADDLRDAEQQCARYYDSHYEYYSAYRPQAQPAYYRPSSNRGCVPCDQPGSVPRRSGCTETVEYEYVDVPVRRAAPRPSKRIKVVPDKRIRLK